MITRRFVLGGLIAAPAVVAFDNLMPVRGIIMPVPSKYVASILDAFGNVLGYAGKVIVKDSIHPNALKFSFKNGIILRTGTADRFRLEREGQHWLGTPLVFSQDVAAGNTFTLGLLKGMLP